MNIDLDPVMKNERGDQYCLYDLLRERQPHMNISHKQMPTMDEHVNFVKNHPYEAWYMIMADSPVSGRNIVGAIYLTKQREVGIGIFKKYKGKGYGYEALKALHRKHPGYLLANINPKNEDSKRFFQNIGFDHIQNTYYFDGIIP